MRKIITLFVLVFCLNGKAQEMSDTAYYKRGLQEMQMRGSNYIGGYHTATNYGNASKSFAKAIELNPKYVDAYFDGANCLYLMEKYSKAIEYYNKVIELSPERAAMAYSFRGCCKIAPRGLSISEGKRDKKGACEDWHKAEELGYPCQMFIKRFCK